MRLSQIIPGPVTTFQDWQPEHFQLAEKATQFLEAELRSCAIDVERIESLKKQVQLFVDFDVIHSVIAPSENQNNISYWSKLFIDVTDTKLQILPGTIVELITFVQKEKRRLLREETAFANAFKSAFNRLKFDQVQVSEKYRMLVDGFNSTEMRRRRAQTLLGLLGKKIEPLPGGELVQYDYDVFYRSIVHLAHGARSTSFENNRVDAYNLALTKALNDRADRNSIAIIVSGAHTMQNLNRAVIQQDDDFSMGTFSDAGPPSFVWRPVRALIYQLLMSANGYANKSEFAWQLVAAISNYRARLRSLRRSFDRPLSLPRSESAGSVDQMIISILTSIEVFQERLNGRGPRQDDAQFELSDEDIAKSYSQLGAELRKLLSDSGARDVVVRTRSVRLALADIEESKDGRINCSIKDVLNNATVAGAYRSNGVVGIYFKSGANIEKFLAVVNFFRQQVTILAQTGELDGERKENAGIIIANDEHREYLRFESIRLPLNTFNLFAASSAGIVSPTFVRVNTHWFDVSFEKAVDEIFVGVATHLPISEQVATFVNELVDQQGKSTDYTRVMNQLFRMRIESNFGAAAQA